MALIKQIKDNEGDTERGSAGQNHSAGMENWNMQGVLETDILSL